MDRVVGTKFSIAPGEVTAKDHRAYQAMMAEGAMARLPKPTGRPWSAHAALFDRKAPGAALARQYRDLGEQVQALYRAASGTGPQITNNTIMSERVGAEGGFLVGEELRSEIMLHTLEQAIIRPRATVIPMREPSSRIPVLEEGSDTSGGVFGGLNFTWTEEQAALSASVASYGLDVLRARKLIAYMVVSNEVFADADRLSTFLRSVIPAGLAFAEDAAFIAGSGTLGGTTLGASQPLGILNAGCAINITRQTSNTVTLQDIYSMITRILPRSMNNYIWLGSPDVVTKILSMFFNFGSATSGIVPPSGWLTWSPDGQLQLLGRPFYTTEHVSALGTQGDLVAVDPQFFLIGDYLELTIEVATEGADFLFDQSQIRVKARLDGRPALASAVTPANSSATVSPIVVLK
jgi:HK97 family phage major capsid protein